MIIIDDTELELLMKSLERDIVAVLVISRRSRVSDRLFLEEIVGFNARAIVHTGAASQDFPYHPRIRGY